MLAGQVAITGLAPGDGGAYDSLALPATTARQLLVPIVLASLFLLIRERSVAVRDSCSRRRPWRSPYRIPRTRCSWPVPLTGFAIVRVIWTRRDVVPLASGLAAVAVPTAAVPCWLRPIVEDTAGHTPRAEEVRRALERYARELDVGSLNSYSPLAPEVFGRSGAVAVAALVAIPLAAFGVRSRWAAYVAVARCRSSC